MNKNKKIACAIALTVAFSGLAGLVLAETPRTQAQYEADPAALIEAYAHVEVASVSDAMEQVLHQKRYMSHSMQAIFPTKFAGFAVTVKMVKQEGATSADVSGMLAAIDAGKPGSVYVMTVQDGADIAGMGGLMGTAMFARGFKGAVIDGGVRDLPQLKRIGFPVYSLGPVPSTSVGHYRFAGGNIPVICDGVAVNPGDIIAADQDGVVVIPRARAAEILVAAEKLDNTEHSTLPFIEKFRSIQEAVAQFGRI